MPLQRAKLTLLPAQAPTTAPVRAACCGWRQDEPRGLRAKCALQALVCAVFAAAPAAAEPAWHQLKYADTALGFDDHDPAACLGHDRAHPGQPRAVESF